jgi:hypothetical protein
VTRLSSCDEGAGARDHEHDHDQADATKQPSRTRRPSRPEDRRRDTITITSICSSHNSSGLITIDHRNVPQTTPYYGDTDSALRKRKFWITHNFPPSLMHALRAEQVRVPSGCAHVASCDLGLHTLPAAMCECSVPCDSSQFTRRSRPPNAARSIVGLTR